ncbi:MAG: hypothetical protein IPH76_07480 [Xanthomonadales bacterium]|nr:hypothetical protein [Xanthomonadales bacterium]
MLLNSMVSNGLVARLGRDFVSFSVADCRAVSVPPNGTIRHAFSAFQARAKRAAVHAFRCKQL